MNSPKPFAFESSQRPPQLLSLIAYNVWAEVALGALSVPLVAELFRKVEDDGNGHHVEFPS